MTKSILKGNVYAADFEATVETFQRPNYTTGTKVSEQVYVTWAGMQCIETGKTQTFQTRYKGNKFINALDSFMNTVLRLKHGSIIFFHNLKGYDYGFITWWGAQHGYTMHGRHSDFYFVVNENKTIRFMDTLAFLPGQSIASLGHMLRIEKGLGEIETPQVSYFDKTTTVVRTGDKDHYEYTTHNMGLDQAFKTFEWDKYAVRDVEILYKTIKHFSIKTLLEYNIGTVASWAWTTMWSCYMNNCYEFEDYIPTCGLEKFDYFNTYNDSEDKDKLLERQNKVMEPVYKGGVTFANPKYEGEHITADGFSYDVNSMYPWIYSSKPLPRSKARKIFVYDNKDSRSVQEVIDEEHDGTGDDMFLMYIANLKATAREHLVIPWLKMKTSDRKLDGDHIQSKHRNALHYEREYNGSAHITSVEYNELLNDYDVTFDHATVFILERDVMLENAFKKFCDYWMNIKTNTKDPAERAVAKIMLNSVYGKLGQYTRKLMRYDFTLDEQTEVIDPTGTPRTSGYYNANIAAAAFITAYGRMEIKNVANQYGHEHFGYTDTDSIHVLGNDVHMEIDDNKLGAWKREHKFDQAVWLHAKTYMEHLVMDKNGEVIDQWISKTAGSNRVTAVENFKVGTDIGVLQMKHVPGGSLLQHSPFIIGGSIVDSEKLEQDRAETEGRVSEILQKARKKADQMAKRQKKDKSAKVKQHISLQERIKQARKH